MCRATPGSRAQARILDGMGFDPTRKHRRRPADYVFVAASVIVALALLAWALLG